MHVGLITYQIGHRKTLEIALKLLTKGYEITLFAFPFVKRPAKIFCPYPDRPAQIMDGFDVVAFCKRQGIRYHPIDGWTDDHAHLFVGCEVYLHCMAKIIPPAFIKDRTIINCHPGLLPKNRGVDAFKWSIVERWPIGVTLHAIDAEIDRGVILYRRIVPILPDDTLPLLCQRAYAFECDLLANFDVHLPQLARQWLVGDDYPISHRAIPKEIDDDLEGFFLRNCEKLIEAQFVQSSPDLSYAA